MNWNQPAKQAAKQLIGKVLVLGDVEVTVLKAAGYPAKDNTGVYEPVTHLSPGEIYIPYKRGPLLLIATKDGGCILVQSIEVNGEIINGPVRVTTRLEITEWSINGCTELHDDDDSVILVTIETKETPPILPTRRPKRRRYGNGIGAATLAKYMPRLAKAYMKSAPEETTFEAYVNGILANCTTEADLRRSLSTR